MLSLEYPEAIERIDVTSITSQTKAKEAIETYVADLPTDAMALLEADLPSGMPASVTKLLPEPVYIPAVKELSDEVKTTKQALFGKLLRIMLDVIQPKLGDLDELLFELQKRLNRTYDVDGCPIDDRIPDVSRIENMLQQNLHETFANVAVELIIPPPDLESILGNASFEVDDGVKGETATKGDGLRRAVTFAIFRSLAQLSMENREVSTAPSNRFLFLFEEPELYLHPIAQTDLFLALGQISQHNQVVLTTHSPYFFRPDNTDRFIKMVKFDADPKPVAKVIQVDLSHWEYRDLFQIVSFETSNNAFFAKRVLLVEGDSDLLVLPHMAGTLDENWDFAKQHIALVKTSGKGSISRFKRFFAHFDIKVFVIADLDILEENFSQLDVDNEVKELRSRLLQKVDVIVRDRIEDGDIVSQGKAKRRLARGDHQAMWAQVQQDVAGYDSGEKDSQTVIDSFEEFIKPLRTVRRRDILRDQSETEIMTLKRELLVELRKLDIYVWEKGSIDDYYPNHIGPRHKPTRAYNFCREIKSRDAILSLSEQISHNGGTMSEFEAVFSSIFGATARTGNAGDDVTGR